MAHDLHNAIQAMLEAMRPLPGGGPHLKPGGPVFCLSRDYGAGGEEIGHKLAEKLGVGYYDAEILNKLVQRTGADPEAMRVIDEGVAKARDLWLYSLVTGQDLSRDTYKRHLVNVIMSLGRMGGVIVGRGAHIVLSKTSAVRVRITGSLDLCAKRVAAKEGLSLEAARQKVQQVNHDRGVYVWDTYQSRLNDPTGFDLTINTDRIGDQDLVVDMLLKARDLIGKQG
jgi:cytidylate kinase